MLSGISVDGASGAENMYFVDGTEISNMYQGNRQMSIAFEFVDEVQFKASGYEAEFGGSLGGVINVITRQGGNAFHGEVLGYYNGSLFNGKERDTLRLGLYDINIAEYVNYQDLYGKDNIDRIEAGFNLGGYIFKDKLWFYGSFLPVLQTTERHVKFDPSAVEGDFPRRDTSWNFQGKLTARPFNFMRLGLSYVNNYNKYKGELPPRNGTGDSADVWPDYGSASPIGPSPPIPTSLSATTSSSACAAGPTTRTTGAISRSSPMNPAMLTAGLGTRSIPTFRPISSGRGGGRTCPSLRSMFRRRSAEKSYANFDLTVYFRLAGEYALKTGFEERARNLEDYADGYKYPDYPNISFAGAGRSSSSAGIMGQGPTVIILSPAMKRPGHWGLSIKSTPTAGPSISRTAGRSGTGSPP